LLILGIRSQGERLYDFPLYSKARDFPEDSVIICLAGGKFRVEAAYSLFAQGVGRKLFIVGAGKKSTATLLGKAHAGGIADKIAPERFSQIEVETESRNTVENAFAVASYLEKHPDVKNIVLVTSGYHMRRAQIMIEAQLKHDTKIFPYTPPTEVIGKSNWWHSWVGIEVTTFEYLKFVLTSLLIPHLGSF